MQYTIQLRKPTFRILSFFVVISLSACDHKPKQNVTMAEPHQATFNNVASTSDSLFLVNAAEINLTEIRLGMLAQQISVTHDIEELGKIMEVDYTKFLNDITYLAVKKQIAIPTLSTKDLKSEYKKLSKKAGRDFDLAYAARMVDKIREAIFIFDNASNKADDREIKAWATAALPDLRTQLDKAMSCLGNAKSEMKK